MRNILIGVIIGLLIGGGIAWAAGQFMWVDGSGYSVGTATKPVYVYFK